MAIFDLRKRENISFMAETTEGRVANRGFGLFPNVLDFIVMAMWVFAAQILVTYLCGLCGMEFPDTALASSPDDQISLLAQLATAQSLAIIYPISMILSIGGILLYGRLRGSVRKNIAHSKVGFDPSRLLGLFLLMVAVQIALEPLTMLMPDAPQVVGRGFFTILVSIVFAPIFEEILCRGIILEAYRSKHGIWAGWICSSLFFGVIHGAITTMVSASILGLILGYAYIRSNSIFAVIILHALNNSLALALMAFNLGNSTFRDVLASDEVYWLVWSAAIVIVAIGAMTMVRNMRKIAIGG